MKKIFIIPLIVCTLFIAGCSSDSKEDEATNETKTKNTVGAKSNCDEPALDKDKNYEVLFETSKGNITVTLDVKNAPISTAHLASLVNSGFYDGLTFHRAVPDFVIQGGDPNGDGTGSSECTIVSEEPRRAYEQGDFAWAKGAAEPAGSAGSQFFLVTGANDSPSVQYLSQPVPGSDQIQYGYAGKITKGLEVALAIEALAPENGDGVPIETVTIIKATLNS